MILLAAPNLTALMPDSAIGRNGFILNYNSIPPIRRSHLPRGRRLAHLPRGSADVRATVDANDDSATTWQHLIKRTALMPDYAIWAEWFHPSLRRHRAD